MAMQEKRLNILFLASWYPNKAEPQAGNFVQSPAQSVAQNYRVCALHVLSVPGKKDYEVETNWGEGVFEVIVYFGKTSKWLPRATHKFPAKESAASRQWSWCR